jgi:hypothetical protein
MKGSGTHVQLSCVATGKLTPDSLYAYWQSNHKKLSTRSAHVRIFEAIMFILLPSFSIEKRNLLLEKDLVRQHCLASSAGWICVTHTAAAFQSQTCSLVHEQQVNNSSSTTTKWPSPKLPSKEPSLAANGLVRHGRECPCWHVRCGYWWDSYDSPRIITQNMLCPVFPPSTIIPHTLYPVFFVHKIISHKSVCKIIGWQRHGEEGPESGWWRKQI